MDQNAVKSPIPVSFFHTNTFSASWETGSLPAVSLRYLPPDLNPQERLFQEIRKALKSKVFYDVEPIEQLIQQELNTVWSNPDKVKQLTNWNWIS